MLKKFLSIGLILAAAATATATAAQPGPFAPSPTVESTPACAAAPARPTIDCGFICDSFGRCRRVCW